MRSIKQDNTPKLAKNRDTIERIFSSYYIIKKLSLIVLLKQLIKAKIINMFMGLFKLIYYGIWKNVEHNDRKNTKDFVPPQNIEISSYYLNEKEDYYDLIKVFKNKDLASKENVPLIINIHGGGWCLKDWIGYVPFYTYFATLGYNTIGFSYYSIKDKRGQKDIVQHIFDVLHYVYDNKDKLGISLDNVFLAGDSAGGQLALFIDSVNRNEELQKVFDVKPVDITFKGLILNHAVAFIEDACNFEGHEFTSKYFVKHSFLKLLFGKNYESSDVFIYSNPYKYLEMVKDYPPILLIASKGDERYLSNEEKLRDAFKSFGIPIDYYYETDERSRHVFNIALLTSDIGIKCNSYIDNFMKKVIQQEKKYE